MLLELPPEIANLPAALRDTDEYKELVGLLNKKANREAEVNANNERIIGKDDSLVEHAGYKVPLLHSSSFFIALTVMMGSVMVAVSSLLLV